jgi:hypothetical protein
MDILHEAQNASVESISLSPTPLTRAQWDGHERKPGPSHLIISQTKYLNVPQILFCKHISYLVIFFQTYILKKSLPNS